MTLRKISLAGLWVAEARDFGGRLLWREEILNGIPTAALTDLLSVYFTGGTHNTAWFAGIIANSGFSTLAATDTSGSHAGWTELTSYSEATRPAWSPTVVGGVATNATAMEFTFTAQAILQGLFIISVATKAGSTGVLFSTASFALPRTMPAGSVLRLTYALRAAGGS